MYPLRSMFEYSSEMNRLIPKTQVNDEVPNIYNQSLFQTPGANKSSSSAESTSPEHYFDTQFPFYQSERSVRSNSATPFQPRQSYEQSYFDFTNSAYELQNNESPIYNSGIHDYFTQRSPPLYASPKTFRDSKRDTPVMAQQRPIVGRKILGGTSQVKAKTKVDSDIDFGIWQMDETNTPPSSYPRSYELFPRSEALETTSSIPSSNLIHISPNLSISPQFSHMNTSVTRDIPSRSHSLLSIHSAASIHNSNYNKFNVQHSSQNIAQSKMCTFCRKNGEMPMVYSNHCVKEKIDGKYVVTCPILRSHVCKVCNASGDDAHTITYCPILRNTNDGKPLTSTTITLKNTRVKSNGMRRY